jgi:hypothetical protein
MAEQASWQRLQPFVDQVIPKALKHGLTDLSQQDQTLFLVWSATAEFDTGGFAHFFHKSVGEHTLPTIAALKRIGADEVADLLEEAVGLFPGGVPADIDERNDALADLPEEAAQHFEELDERFQQIGSDAVLDQLADHYLEKT